MNPIYDFYHFEFTNGQKAWIRRDQIIAITPTEQFGEYARCQINVKKSLTLPINPHSMDCFEVNGETADDVITRLATGVYHRISPAYENTQRLDQILPPLQTPEPNPLQSFPTP